MGTGDRKGQARAWFQCFHCWTIYPPSPAKRNKHEHHAKHFPYDFWELF